MGNNKYGDEVIEMMAPQYTYKNIAGANTYVIKSGSGFLKSILFNRLISLGTITVYDNTSATGTKIATVTNPLTLVQSTASLEFMCAFTNGLTVVTSAADDITVIYK